MSATIIDTLPGRFTAESVANIAHALPGSMTDTPAVRQACKQAQGVMEDAFDNDVDIMELVHARAAFVDAVLCNAWARMVPNQNLALVAVGGYGRGELHPHSDVDILILVDQQDDSLGETLGQFLTFLWDIGLEIGHSVRTPAECASEAADDLTIATNMMESRLLHGSEELYETMRQETGPDRIWPARDFFKAKLEEQRIRHHRFHETGYKVEPNIKESPGGLRDLQTIGWTLSRGFGLQDLKDLVDIGFLKKDECAVLMEGKAFLSRVRFALHAEAGRREDRLLFDHQVALARRFKYCDEDSTLAVEQFMQTYYRQVQELSRLNEMLLQLLQEEVLFNDASHEPVRLSNDRYQSIHGYLEFSDKTIIHRFPFALLEIFLTLAQNRQLKGIRARTIRLIRDNLWRIDDGFRNDIRARSLFLELLREPVGITHALRAMHRYGVLDAYIPAFGKIAGLMQYDLFHIYTVDEHTLMVLRNARRLFLDKYAEQVPTANRVAKLVHKPHLLFVACLFHDIAKGRGGDHSQLGADEARDFCVNHQFGRYDTNLVVWLVRSHLLMSMTTQRMDISDPEVVRMFAAQVGDETHLHYLYLLTVADIRGTNPELWTDWKAALLRELYHSARTVLRRGIEHSDTADQYISDRKADALSILNEIDPAKVEALWSQFTDDYFLRHTFQEIAWHAQVVIEATESGHQTAEQPIIAISNEATRAGTAIFVYSKDSKGLFALCTAILAQHGLDVLDARILTTRDGHTLDTFTIFDEAKTPLRNQARLDHLERSLKQALASPDQANLSTNRHIPRQLKHFNMKPVIGFDSDINNGLSVMELMAPDRPGLLSAVGKAFASCDVSLVNARVTTLGERAEDVFFIT
ncbi:MAG: [protein-PII] uridylyltransferase, partial [Gammaproteobacteria bacterium]